MLRSLGNFGRRFSVVAVIGAGLLAHGAARADCAAPETEILWSYPAQGDTGVPINADFWVLVSGWGLSYRARLDGVELSRSTQFNHQFDLPELAPNTSYTIEVEVPSNGAGSFEVSFTTGADPAALDFGADPGTVTARAQREVTLSPLCEAVLQTQDCFDTGQDTHFTFEPSGSAEAWIIESGDSLSQYNLWPAACGTPELYLHSSARPCATLHGIDIGGKVHGGQSVCTQTLGDILGNEEASCALKLASSRHGWWYGLAALAAGSALFLRRLARRS